MKVRALSCVFINDHPLISCFFPFILGFFRISWQDSWHFLDFLTRFLVISERFFVLKTFFERFFNRKIRHFSRSSWQDLARSYIFLAFLVRILSRFLPRLSGNCKIFWQEFQDMFHWEYRNQQQKNVMSERYMFYT